MRFLNDVGGGEIVGFQGRDIAVVRDADGFDIPTLVKECVVVSTDSYNIARPQPAEKNDAPSVPVRQLLHPVEEEEDNRPLPSGRSRWNVGEPTCSMPCSLSCLST